MRTHIPLGSLAFDGATQLMPNGTADFFHDREGYGFIASDEADDDICFLMEDVDGPDFGEEQAVEFDLESSPKGTRTADLQRA